MLQTKKDLRWNEIDIGAKLNTHMRPFLERYGGSEMLLLGKDLRDTYTSIYMMEISQRYGVISTYVR